MTNFSMNSPQLWLDDVEAFSPESIALSAEQIDQAVQLSSQIPNQARQWQTYLNALALFAFEEWLAQRSAELSINREDSILQPATANAIEAVCNLQVNQFKVCLIATGSLTDEEVTLPRAAVDLPEFVPHFYVLVEVQEELETAVVYGVLSYQQLMERQATTNLSAEEDWTYQLPLNWFESDPDRLLLYLRCLEPTAISLPAVPNNRLETLSNMQRELATLLPQLSSGDRQLWQVLTWEQGTAVLTSPELLSWVYQAQQVGAGFRHPEGNDLVSYLSDLLQLISQPVVNVGRWLWDELDEFAQQLSWVFLPNLAPAALRSPTQEFETIASQLYNQGVEIPFQARGAYRDVLLAGTPLRLYAVTWSLPSESDGHWWTLLLILGAPSETTLPYGLKLRVSDQTGVLVEQQVNSESGDSYLFTRVVGSWEEKFLVSFSLANGIELTLPPFAFNPE